MSTSEAWPYRPLGRMYGLGYQKNPSTTGAPWLLLSEQEIAEWMIRHPEATSPSATILRCLAWLDHEFGFGR